jgi:hypothetical protein
MNVTDLCKNGKLVTVSEDNYTDSNGFTHVHRVQRCVFDPSPISIGWIVGISVFVGFCIGVCIVCWICSRRSSQVEPGDLNMN